MKFYSYILLFILAPFVLSAQNNHQQFESIDSVSHGSFNPNEAHSFHEWFKKGHVSGLFRSNFISTYRPESQHFSGAAGLGGRIYYHSAYWHGFQIGIGGIYTYNILSTDLSNTTESFYLPKWERQLFDLEDPDNKHDLDRLEELFIKYRHKDSYVKIGKMLLNTPLVNPQDSRMKPSAFQGIWIDWNEGHRFEINGGFFNKVSPRSTTEWIEISESINLYDHLLDPDSSHYVMDTKGLLIAGGHYIPNEKISFHSWQYLIENISFITFNQIEYQESKVKLGLQYYFQNAVNENHYLDQDHIAHKISGQIKWTEDKWQLSYNQTANLSDYAMKFPSEWGAEPFYTFISRHRIMGLEQINSRALKLDIQPFNNWESLNIGLYGVHSSFSQSKASNSMTQLSLDIQTHFKGNWKALKLRFLNSYFITDGFSENDFLYESIYHSQLILNYRF
ncbi:outer membrane porin, OprD family [Marivirga sericea]|uniref:Outer membrane porin, OprD family n=1 Tax=Marivirga sericea TaxID=1028 RepID=A0A1X7JNU3_9BACT|nr:OprD family outer membrane porin [Marivirga sericea]SMG29674.1 outer membrane porin, OprD family [Marivirga sericea]